MYEVAKTPLEGGFTFLPIDDVYYGPNAIAGLGQHLAAHNVEKALLITGNTLANKTTLVEKVMDPIFKFSTLSSWHHLVHLVFSVGRLTLFALDGPKSLLYQVGLPFSKRFHRSKALVCERD